MEKTIEKIKTGMLLSDLVKDIEDLGDTEVTLHPETSNDYFRNGRGNMLYEIANSLATLDPNAIIRIHTGEDEKYEKTIPKKPLYKRYEEKSETPYIKICCPNGCHVQLRPVTEKQLACEHVCCPKCGQRIDWTDWELPFIEGMFS